ncbi:MAG: hypothetical protein HY094_02135 [Candidatus Melainabacteria bacterium]|nr:hypothetical protein [Candidatus Melainabacteria bacterium]
MKNKLLTNNFINSKDRLKLIQKAILTGIGVAASKDSIKKAATGIYNDVQKIIKKLLTELEESGEIKTKETRKIIQKLQKKSEIEKAKIYKKLQKEGKTLLKSAREIISTPVAVLKEVTTSLDKNRTVKNRTYSGYNKKHSAKTKKRTR